MKEMLRFVNNLLFTVILIVCPSGSAWGDCPVGDLDRNCKVDFDDVWLFAQQWLVDANHPADFSGNGVNNMDFSLLAKNWRVKGTSLVISEFMVSNASESPLSQGELLDEDGIASDWIEIHNPTSKTVNLGGWYLTDDPNELDQWEFPATTIDPDEYKVVFASAENRRDSDSELHTNFKLKASKGALLLVYPDGQTIAHGFDNYPPGYADISYGLSDNAGLTIDTTLIPEYAPARALVPADAAAGLDWTEVGFDDSEWKTGTTGVGYDTGSEYDYLLNLDVAEMIGKNETVYVRIAFEITEAPDFDKLTLYMKRDDGFASYLNGNLMTEANALADVTSLAWNSGATGTCSDAAAHDFEEYDITKYKHLLQTGDNLLAIHGLNSQPNSSDSLILPKLVAGRFESIDSNSVSEGYFMTPSPGAVNGGAMQNLGPAVHNVTEYPPRPAAGEDIAVTARVRQTADDIRTATLHYRAMYNSENTLPMYDDGLHGDGGPGDGVYGALIPAGTAAPGQMVRWCVTAEDQSGRNSRNPLFPYPNNSPEYYGTVIDDPSVVTALPVMEWFVENVSASESTSGTRCSLYYDGQFYDNVDIHIRGGSTQGASKKHFKFVFNRGYKFRYRSDAPRVNEFNLNSTYSDKAYIRQNLAFEAYDWCGCPGSESFLVRAQRNAQFHGVQVFIEEPEEELLEREGLDPDGALYKMYNTFNTGGSAEKKTRSWEGRTDLDEFCRSINDTSGTIRRNNIFDRVNLPLTLNFLAATVLTHQNDHPHKNHYLYRDSDGSGEWFFLPWDHDLTWGSNWTGSSYLDGIYADDDQVPGRAVSVKPSHPFIGRSDCREWNNFWNKLIDALLNDETVREMFKRRLRTVMDDFLRPSGRLYSNLFIEKRIDDLVAQAGPDVELDYYKWADPWGWGDDQSFIDAIDILKNEYLAVRRTHLFITHNIDNKSSYPIPNSFSAEIPNAQPGNPTIQIRAYDYNPASLNQDQEYIELYNPNAYSVDISLWRLTDAIEHTFLPGTVIVPGQSLYVCPNSAAFRGRTSGPTGNQGLFVQGNYKGHLSSWGETITLMNKEDSVVDTLNFPGSPSLQQRYLRITELMYHPAQGGAYNEEEYEYVELKNIGETPLLLDDVKFTGGIYYEFTAGENRYLDPGEHIVIVKNQDSFAERYDASGMNIAPDFYTGSLSNAGEEINIEDMTNSTILNFDYDDDWFDITDGQGFSLSVIDPNNPDLDAWDRKKGWRASAYPEGSPGSDDSGILPDPGDVVINEILAHSHGAEADWIELHNTTNSPIDIGGWRLSDSDDDLQKYQFAVGTKINAHDYLVLYEDSNFGDSSSDPGKIIGFAFNENGDQAYLSSAEADILTGYRAVEDFGASHTGVSFGRYYKSSTDSYNFVPMDRNTPDAANSYPAVGPVVISEIMYNPQSGDQREEYIELHNFSPTDVTLYDSNEGLPWKFTDGIDYTFQDYPGLTMAAGGYVLIVKDVAVYIDEYGMPPFGVTIFGPYSGSLSNSGEKLELSTPGDVDLYGERCYIRVDRVNYSDGSHHDDAPGDVDLWPIEADGGGKSLSRTTPELYGNDPNNWTPADPQTPGK